MVYLVIEVTPYGKLEDRIINYVNITTTTYFNTICFVVFEYQFRDRFRGTKDELRPLEQFYDYNISYVLNRDP